MWIFYNVRSASIPSILREGRWFFFLILVFLFIRFEHIKVRLFFSRSERVTHDVGLLFQAQSSEHRVVFQGDFFLYFFGLRLLFVRHSHTLDEGVCVWVLRKPQSHFVFCLWKLHFMFLWHMQYGYLSYPVYGVYLFMRICFCI